MRTSVLATDGFLLHGQLAWLTVVAARWLLCSVLAAGGQAGRGGRLAPA